MASNIKGIVIEIEGKTSGLVSALKDVDKSVKNTQTALKKVNEALKLDPKNITLVAEKQKLLQQQIENTSERLQLLEQAARDAEEALANGDISEAEYAQLAAEVELARQELERLNNEANNSNGLSKAFEEAGKKIQEVGEKVEEVGEKIKGVGEGYSKYVTAPIVATGTASVAAFKDVDASMDIVIKKTGATGDELERLEEIFRNIATTVPVDMDVVGAAIGEVSTRFGVTGDELETLSVAFIKFSQINNTDVSNSVDNVQKALAAFGLDAEYAEELLDRLSSVSQDSGANVDTLTAGLIQNAAAFQEMGLSIDQAAEFMGELETSGANSETVMQGMRKALKNAAEDGTDLNTALMDLQNAILNGTDDMDGLTYAYEMFGKSGDQIYSSVKNGTLDFNDLGKAAEDAGGTVSRTFDATNDPLNNSRTALNKLKLTLGDVGETIAKLVAPVIENLSAKLDKLNKWWNSLSEGTQKFIIKAAAVIAAIGPIIAIIGSLVIGIGQAITAVGVISAALGTTGLAATFAALAPIIGTVVAAIAAVVAIGWGLYEIVTNVIDIIQNWDVLMGALAEDLGGVFGNIKEGFESLVGNIGSGIDNAKQKFEDLKNSAKEKFENIKQDAQEKWDAVKSHISDAIDGAKGKFEEIKGTSQEAWDTIKSKITESIDGARATVSEKVETIKGYFTDMATKAFTWGKDLLKNFIDGIKSMWNSFTGTIGDLTGYIKANLGFSEPEEGPLSNFHTFAPDMIDLWNKGIYDNLGKVQESSEAMAQTVATGVQPTDYSGVLSGIQSSLSGFGKVPIQVNVMVGGEQLDSYIINASNNNNFKSGGF